MLSPESQGKTNEEFCLDFESIDQIKYAWLTLNYYMTHVIIVLSLWSPRERSQVLESEFLATWASLRSFLVSYSKGEAGLFLHHPKQQTPHQKFREHLISSVSSGTQYLFLYSLIEYLLWSFAMHQQNGDTTAVLSGTCQSWLSLYTMTTHVRVAKPSPLYYTGCPPPCRALFIHLDKIQGKATLEDVSKVRAVILKCQIQDRTLGVFL